MDPKVLASQNIAQRQQRLLDATFQNTTVPQPNFSWQFKKLVIIRLLTENTLLFLLQYLGIILGSTYLAKTAAPVSFASGTACAFIFMRGYTILPGMMLGGLCAYYFLLGKLSLSILGATVDVIQVCSLLWFCHAYISPTLVFYDIKKFIKFLYLCVLVTAASTTLLYYSHINWVSAWLSNLIGILVFTLTILTWDFYFSQIDELKQQNKLKFGFYYGLLSIAIMMMLFSNTLLQLGLCALTTFSIIVFINLSWGWCGVIAAIFLHAILLNFGNFMSAPLFTQNSPLFLIIVQLSLLAESICGISLALIGNVD